MKKTLIATLFLFVSVLGYAQCVPDTASGTPGVTPAPNGVPCIERGVPYSITMQIENFTTIGTAPLSLTVDSARIDSITNFPCGITWQASKLTYLPGETGCILVSGTTNDNVGQYPLKIYMTVSVTTPFGSTTQSGEISSILAQSPIPIPGINLGYYSRVVDSGDACPAIDTSASAVNLTACGPVNLTASISGGSAGAVCPGTSATLTASAVNRTGTVTYSWSTGATTASITVAPAATTLYTVTATDQNGSTTATKTITVTPLPTAAFTAVDSGAVVTINNTTTNAVAYAWDFDDDSTSTLQNPPAHTYTSNGTKTIRLIATNLCGADTTTQDVTITGVFIQSVEYDLSFEVFPNPSNGNIAVSFSADNTIKEYTLEIFDLNGKSVFQQAMTATGSVQKQLDLHALPKGVYTLKLSSGTGFGVKKLQLN